MIIVERIAPDGSAQRISIREHELLADMLPPDGQDEGPDPHDLYDAALGACKAMTLVWFAKRQGIPLEDVRVGVIRDASEERKGVYKLTTRISIDGPMTDEQREKLFAVADKCPIHKLMADGQTEIETVPVRQGE